MKYKIHTIVVTAFFFLFAVGLAFAHYQEGFSDATENENPEPEPLELPTIMRMLLADIDLINDGIYTENYVLIEQGASNINEHPPLSPKSRQLVKNTLGDRMPTFGEYDRIVHSRADSLRNAARQKDMNAILKNYRIIQQGCVNCHSAFQEEIREARINQ